MSDDRPSISELQREELSERSNAAPIPLRSAAPVLLEIIAAALAYEKAKDDTAVVRYIYASHQDRSGDAMAAITRHNSDEIRCHEAYRAALAKVRP